MTKKLQAQIDKIHSAVERNTEVQVTRNAIEQRKVLVLSEIANALKMVQVATH